MNPRATRISYRLAVAAILATALVGGAPARGALFGSSAGACEPTAQEQYFLELLNTARTNPLAEARRLNVDFTAGGKFGVAPRPPFRLNSQLLATARTHSRSMADSAFFGHKDPHGRGPLERMLLAGYAATGCAESIAAGDETPDSAVDRLLVDDGIPDLKHRLMLLGVGDYAQLDEVGVGIHQGSGPYGSYYTVELARDAAPSPFLVGVVYRDRNRDGAYDAGEGLPGVRVELGDGTTETTTGTAGGYSVPIEEPGSYVVTLRGPGMPAPRRMPVRIGSVNTKLDLVLQ